MRLRTGTVAACVAAAIGTGAAAHAARPAPAIESCVSPAKLELGEGDERAMLETADAEAVFAAAVERYPALVRDGVLPSHLMLLQRPTGDPLFVALLADPQDASNVCFLATVSGRAFDFTPALVWKYLKLGQA